MEKLYLNGIEIKDIPEEKAIASYCYSTDEGKYNRHRIEVLTIKDSIADKKMFELYGNKDKYTVEINLIKNSTNVKNY